jgi:hypothetical protein
MTDERSPSPSGEPTFIKKMGSSLLIFLSIAIGVLLVELFCHLFLPSISNNRSAYNAYRSTYRVVFFDGGEAIFRNHGDIFTYTPHNEIRNMTGFLSEHDFNVEYDYHIRTNNFGLVQDADVMPERESLLLLGDSFTEGQGAEPWFRLIAPEVDKLGYQAVNGGLLGTGFEQWLKLERYLATKDVRTRKLVILFISDDYDRHVWNFTPNNFRCLSALPFCHVEESYFYRLPPPEELSSWIAKIRTARAPVTKKIWLKARVEALLPASYHVYEHFKERLQHPAMIARFERAEQESRAVIAELIRIYHSENVAFIHLPQKQEIDNGPNNLGLKARRSIQEAGGKLFDGFKLCRLTAVDYYLNDDHPNSSGYAKIAACVNNVISELITGVQ